MQSSCSGLRGSRGDGFGCPAGVGTPPLPRCGEWHEVQATFPSSCSEKAWSLTELPILILDRTVLKNILFTFVDTPGAYPGIDAEERCQSEAIGRCIFEMAQLEVPIITSIIGEGGSGGALAISVGDQVLMLQYSVYSVISPEGCASILWKTSDKAKEAADALGITAHRLKALGLVDKIVNEPVGGAHRDHKQMASFLKRALGDAYRQISDLKLRELLDRRYARLQSFGRFTDTKADPKVERRAEPRVSAK